MIDIHSHILPLVDDGSTSLNSSIQMLKELAEAGVTDLIVTPHYRGKFNLAKEEIRAKFLEFQQTVREIPVNLYLGREIYVEDGMLKRVFEGEFLTLNNTKYILLEFDYYIRYDIVEAVYMARNKGLIPIVAHIERYEYLTIDDAFEIKSLGGLIQVNASSLHKRCNKLYYKRVKELIKEDLVDFVASDCHEFRKNYINYAFKKVQKRFGKEKAQNLFYNNALSIIKD